jgi:hypothetical protein
MRIYSARALVWDGPTLRLGNKRARALATVVPDADWPGMYRVRRSGHTSDMVNLTRAKDAAACLALADLNTQETPAEAPRIRYFERAATTVQPST